MSYPDADVRSKTSSGPDLSWQQPLSDIESYAANHLPAEIPVDLIQRLFQLSVQIYYQKRDAGESFGPFYNESVVSGTEGIVAAANILEAVEIEVFEFGMFKMLADG